MPRTQKQTERDQKNIARIKADLADNPVLHVAAWPDADSIGMYLVAPDGRTLACGDYEKPVDHIDQLAGCAADVASHLTPLSDAFDDESCVPELMRFLEPKAQAWADGTLPGSALLDLMQKIYYQAAHVDVQATSPPPNKWITTTQDLQKDLPSLSADGTVVMTPVTFLKAGDSVQAFVEMPAIPGCNPVLVLPLPPESGAAGFYVFPVGPHFTPGLTVSDLPTPVVPPGAKGP